MRTIDRIAEKLADGEIVTYDAVIGFFATALPVASEISRRLAPKTRIHMPQKVTANGSRRNSCAQNISRF